jgi:uncharacterized membrane protein
MGVMIVLMMAVVAMPVVTVVLDDRKSRSEWAQLVVMAVMIALMMAVVAMPVVTMVVDDRESRSEWAQLVVMVVMLVLMMAVEAVPVVAMVLVLTVGVVIVLVDHCRVGGSWT